MTITYAGNLTLGQAVPGAQDAQVEIAAAANAALPDVQARVTGLLAISVQPPPTLASLIASLNAALAAAQALVAAPLPDVSATAAALADLQATLGSLQASLSLSISLGNLLATPGIHYYVYAGRADQVANELGGQVSAGLPGGSGGAEQIAGAILLANDGGAITALQTLLKS